MPYELIFLGYSLGLFVLFSILRLLPGTRSIGWGWRMISGAVIAIVITATAVGMVHGSSADWGALAAATLGSAIGILAFKLIVGQHGTSPEKGTDIPFKEEDYPGRPPGKT